MGNHCRLRADGVSGPAEAKLWGKGRKGVKEKFQGLYSERKDTTQWELPSTFRTRSRWSCTDLYNNGPRLGARLGGSRK